MLEGRRERERERVPFIGPCVREKTICGAVEIKLKFDAFSFVRNECPQVKMSFQSVIDIRERNRKKKMKKKPSLIFNQFLICRSYPTAATALLRQRINLAEMKASYETLSSTPLIVSFAFMMSSINNCFSK